MLTCLEFVTARTIATRESLRIGQFDRTRRSVMAESGIGPRRDAIVARLRAARTGYERCVGDVSPEIGMDGTEWSILDLLHHSIDSGYQDMASRLATSHGKYAWEH
jgi:hypothetical protein